MWILQTDKSYLNSNDNEWLVVKKDSKWNLYKNNVLVGIFNTLEQAIGAGPA